MKGSAGLCRPRFSFFNIQLSKNRHRRRGVVARTLVARGRSSVAHAALLNFAEGRSRSELLRRQRRAALVGEAYIVGARPKCQQRFQSFLRRTVTLLASQFRGALGHVLGAICYLSLRATQRKNRLQSFHPIWEQNGKLQGSRRPCPVCKAVFTANGTGARWFRQISMAARPNGWNHSARLLVPSAKNEAAERASQRDRPETLNTSSRPISLDDCRRRCRSAREQGDSP